MPTVVQRPSLPPAMHIVIERWLAMRRLTDRPMTISRLALALRRFSRWLGTQEPGIRSFAQVDRPHVLRYLTVLMDEPLGSTGRPMAPNTRIGHISALAVFSGRRRHGASTRCRGGRSWAGRYPGAHRCPALSPRTNWHG